MFASLAHWLTTVQPFGVTVHSVSAINAGAGTQTAVALVLVKPTATNAGTGAQTGVSLVLVKPSALNAGTGSQTGASLVLVKPTASNAGTGAQTGTSLVIVKPSGSNTGTGSQTATVVATVVVTQGGWVVFRWLPTLFGQKPSEPVYVSKFGKQHLHAIGGSRARATVYSNISAIAAAEAIIHANAIGIHHAMAAVSTRGTHEAGARIKHLREDDVLFVLGLPSKKGVLIG